MKKSHPSFKLLRLGAGLLRKLMLLASYLWSMLKIHNFQAAEGFNNLTVSWWIIAGLRAVETHPVASPETSTCYLPLRRRRGFKASKSLTWKMVWEFMTRLNLSRKSHWRAVWEHGFKKSLYQLNQLDWLLISKSDIFRCLDFYLRFQPRRHPQKGSSGDMTGTWTSNGPRHPRHFKVVESQPSKGES